MLSTQVAATSATIDFTTGLNDTYDAYMIDISDVVAVSDDVDLYLRVGTGVGPTWIATGTPYAYVLAGGRVNLGASGLDGVNGTANQIALTALGAGAGSGLGSNTGESFSGRVWISNPEGAALFKRFKGQSVYDAAAGDLAELDIGARYTSVTAITGLRFLLSTGNIASGRFTLYGLTKS